MKLWKKLTAAVLMSAVILGAGVTAKPLFASLTGAEITAQAADEEVTVGDLTFTKNGTYAVVSDCDEDAVSVNIPAEVDGLPVTSIGNSAFSGCTGLTSITIPDSVTSIGYAAFYDCKSLTGITIPDSVTSISDWALGNCTSLTSITIPDSVTSIGNYAFYNCTGLTSITITDSVTSIGDYAFSGCTGLTSITIPDSVTSIGISAFNNCTSLTNITIPDSVTSIGGWALGNCTGLTSITIPDSVISIGSWAFYDCSELNSVKLGNSLTSIGSNAFQSCDGLTSITIPDSVTNIYWCAFAGCTSLTKVTLGNSVTSIDSQAFYLCDGLTSITIPDSVTKINFAAFSGCKNLTSITIPDSVTSIGASAFRDCSKLTSVTIPDSVTSIGNYAFEKCTGLTSITIPSSVKSIGMGAFSLCTGLTIYGFTGSYAEQYAEENNIPFFALEPKQIGDVTLSRAVFQYTGNPVKVGSYITVFDDSTKLKYGTDFTLSYSNNVKCGKSTAKVTVKGTGKYAGSSVTKTYSIAPALSTKDGKLHIEWNKVSGADGYQVQYCKNSSFTGDTLHSTSVTNGKLYCDLATYPKSGESWCVRVRSFTLTSTGNRKYAEWSGISVLKLNKISNVELKYTAFHYKGKEIKVGKYLKVYSGNTKLVYERDFVLEYKNNVNRGTATVTVKGIGEFAGSSVSKTYKIV